MITESSMLDGSIAFISQPMTGLMNEEILKTRNNIIEWCKHKGLNVLDSFFADEFSVDEMNGVKNAPIKYLARSIDIMSKADVVIFADGWKKARGCWIEYLIATAYGLPIIQLSMHK